MPYIPTPAPMHSRTEPRSLPGDLRTFLIPASMHSKLAFPTSERIEKKVEKNKGNPTLAQKY